ncbi:MAG: hypothetical protein EAZ77_18155 [Nostocales cyanobacterium]|nr:MAG: hypothetical protein EAZ77_18155 [Nostocales cyanobacterium]
MNSTIRVGNLFGIPFYIHPSWFLVLGLVTWSYRVLSRDTCKNLQDGLETIAVSTFQRFQVED